MGGVQNKEHDQGLSPHGPAVKHAISLLCVKTIPHSKLKYRLKEAIQMCFIKKKSKRRYKFIVLRKAKSYFNILVE